MNFWKWISNDDIPCLTSIKSTNRLTFRCRFLISYPRAGGTLFLPLPFFVCTPFFHSPPFLNVIYSTYHPTIFLLTSINQMSVILHRKNSSSVFEFSECTLFFLLSFSFLSLYSVYLSIILIPMCVIKRVLTYPHFFPRLLHNISAPPVFYTP